ncbi:C-methyltransferase C-terminal domain protein [Leptospira interrogans serovar Grippotyphosa str. LT2186]|uniref:C-methyltransferase C-terminal domain protein n=1 Tax=Leptospira interrogans serovar Grippotyphosa str. LT2186 TaxID=1001599 RepID=M3H1U4_LEPIR|nr:C-methyltransferase C-terminal domain protein [Leptospira interrogans serovar Grippotyphosa str. LT2186]
MHIPVKHPDVLNSEGDAVLIVLAWRYFDLIRSKLKIRTHFDLPASRV